MNWYSSTGTAFNKEPNSFEINDESYTYNRFNAVGDFDGDGRIDVASYGSDLYSGINKGENIYLYNSFNAALDGNLVNSVTNGLGIEYQIKYRPLTYTMSGEKSYYEKGINASYPICDIQIPLYCVSQVITPDGIGGNTATEYSYSGAMIELTGKGFLGFTQQTVANATQNRSSTTTVELDPGYGYVMPKTKTTLIKTYEGSGLSQNVVKYNNSLNNGVYDSQLLYQDNVNLFTKLGSSTEYSDYEDGNPKTVKTTTGKVADDFNYELDNTPLSFQETGGGATERFTYISKASPFKNKVESDIVTKTFGSDTYTRTKTFAYDEKGNLTKEVIDPTDVNAVTTDYKLFDSFGHPTQIDVTVKIDSVDVARSSKVSYTESGRFVLSKKDILGKKVTYNWDEARSLLNYETYTVNDDPNTAKTTSYTYNDLNALIETKYPDGKKSAEVLQWARPGNDIKATYYKYSETSGTSPVYEWYDVLGREIQKDTYGLNGKKISVSQLYNGKSQLWQTSYPYFNVGETIADNAKVWATKYEYDDYGRPMSVQSLVDIASKKYNTTSTEYRDSERKTIVTSADGTIKETKINISGQTEYEKTNGKSVVYVYYASGQVKTSTPDGGQPLEMVYDLQGHRTKLTDPDAGVVESKYNGFGEMVWEKQKVHKPTTGQEEQMVWTTNTYDETTGLLQNILRQNKTVSGAILTSEKTEYVYDAKKRVETIKIADQHEQTFVYDDFDRVTGVTEKIGNRSYYRSTEYDALGREKRNIYPSGYYTYNVYDTYSNLKEVKDKADRSIWQAIDENVLGQLKTIAKGVKQTTFEYDDRGMPTLISSDAFNTSYHFDAKGNLEYRVDADQKEVFTYDAQNRLTDWDVYKSGVLKKENWIFYNTNTGNIEKKSNIYKAADLSYPIFSYGENNGKPHALTSLSSVPDIFPTTDLKVTYTDFKKISTLSEGVGQSKKDYTLSYGVDDQRRKSEYAIGGATKLTRYFLGDYEEEIDAAGNVRKIHYLSGGDGLAAIYIQNNGSDSLMYAYTDYQGSLMALTDVNGKFLENYAYDPWGARRNPEDWTQKDTRTRWILNRGYTGHEHLDAFSIINMNGRVYDPLTSMFMSPDPYVQAPGNWLNYNRYGYCLGNPFKYTDPSGELFGIDDAIIIATLATSALQGGAMSQMNGGSFLKGAAIGAAKGALSLGVSYGLSQATAGIGNFFGHGGVGSLGNELLRAGSHGIVNGVSNAITGGDFGTGFATGALSSLAGSGLQAAGASDELVRMGCGVAGGLSSGLMDGDMMAGFGGFMQGYSIGALNHTGDRSADKNGNTYTEDSKGQLVRDQPLPTLEASADSKMTKAIDAVGKTLGGAGLGVEGRAFIEKEYVRQARINRALSGDFSQSISHSMRGINKIGKRLGAAGIVVTGVDIAYHGVNVSNSLDLVMGGIAFTGWGAPVSGLYFIGNLGWEAYTGNTIGESIQGTFTNTNNSWKPW